MHVGFATSQAFVLDFVVVISFVGLFDVDVDRNAEHDHEKLSRAVHFAALSWSFRWPYVGNAMRSRMLCRIASQESPRVPRPEDRSCLLSNAG